MSFFNEDKVARNALPVSVSSTVDIFQHQWLPVASELATWNELEATFTCPFDSFWSTVPQEIFLDVGDKITFTAMIRGEKMSIGTIKPITRYSNYC